MAALTDKTVYIDAPTGLAGDMLMAALLDAGGDEAALRQALSRLPLGEWQLTVSPVSQQGLAALDVAITYPHQHQHRHLPEIEAMIQAAAFPQRAEALALSAFRQLAAAEAAAHGCAVEDVHFHEVGAVDSILDICGVALLADMLCISRVFCSPLPLTSGYVDCEHGRLPVPAPATAQLLQGFRLIPSDIQGEAVTPTGAALLRALGAVNGKPDFYLEAIGRGAGKRKLSQVNMVRVLLGTAAGEAALADLEQDEVEVLTANIDDAGGELLARLWQKAFDQGALDLCFLPIFMKKGRPAWQVQLIAPLGQGEAFARLLLAETTALGCRISRQPRYKAPRRSFSVDTPFGPIAVKQGANTLAPEADSVAQAAAEHGSTFKEVYAAALAAAITQQNP